MEQSGVESKASGKNSRTLQTTLAKRMTGHSWGSSDLLWFLDSFLSPFFWFTNRIHTYMARWGKFGSSQWILFHWASKNLIPPQRNHLCLTGAARPSKLTGPNCEKECTNDEIRCVVNRVVDHVHRRSSSHVTQQLGRHRLLGLDGG